MSVKNDHRNYWRETVERLNVKAPPTSQASATATTLAPEAYSETAGAWQIDFTDKELSARLIAIWSGQIIAWRSY